MQRLGALNTASVHVRNVLKTEFKTFKKHYSSKHAVKIKEDVREEISKHFEKMSRITPKIRNKQPQKPPFVKNLFLGKFDVEVLAYPQLITEDQQALEKGLAPVQSCFDNLSPEQSSLSDDFVDILRHLNLFGMQSSQLRNGRELSVIEHCRFNEILSSVPSTAPGLLYNEFLGIHALERAGTEQQKAKYLSQLIDGKLLSAFCMTESENQDIVNVSTVAKRNEKKTGWILNGTKTGVVNGSTAGLLIVVARTAVISTNGVREPKLTLFLVDRDFEGITVNTSEMLGIEGTNVSDITFKDTFIPTDNQLGEVNMGGSLISSLLTEYRLSSGPACSTLIRNLLNKLTDYCIHTNVGQLSISETDCVRSVVAEITFAAYATESVTYLTAGLLDEYENQDCLMESSIVKIFGANQAYQCALKAMDILGTPSYKKNYWCNSMLRDALSYRYLNEVGENLNVWVALLGLQYAGIQIQEDVRKLRNPLFFATEVMKRMWTHYRQQNDNPKMKLKLFEYVHPTLAQAANALEYCVLRLQYATETLLVRHGSEIPNQHMDLKRLGECVVDIYVMTACLARASRAYCIGLRNGQFEVMLAGIYCEMARKEIQRKMAEISGGPFNTFDDSYRTIAKRVFRDGKYPFDHPISRNF